MTEIGKNVFYLCKKLTKITFGQGKAENLSIGSNVFENCRKIKDVSIPDHIAIGWLAFNVNDLDSDDKEINIIIDAETENVQFCDYCFGYKGVASIGSRIYVRNDAMKEKIKSAELYVKPENVIVGIPQRDE